MLTKKGLVGDNIWLQINKDILNVSLIISMLTSAKKKISRPSVLM